MPLYDYRCHKCGETFEVRQKFTDEPLHVHDACGGELERLISAPALQFKGTGWYVTDYARNGKTSASSTADSKTESKSDAKTDTKKAESKPAPASPSKDK